jgi:methyl-accepting chemotaxis protein
VLPEVTARLDADVSGFIGAWDRAADAAQRNAARIRAAIASLPERTVIRVEVDIDNARFNDFNAELERMTRNARAAGDSLRDFGNNARRAGDGVNELGDRARNAGGGLDDLAERARRAGDSLGGGGGGRGGGLAGGFRFAGMSGGALAAVVALVASILPAIAAAALAAGAALQGLGVVAGVIIGGWRGIEQAGEKLKATLGGLQKQLESVFRAELSKEFQKLGQAISTMDGPLKAIARSTSDVIKEFTGWIRSSEGMKQIEAMLGGVDNMMKSLAPGAKALAQAFTAFGEAAAPAMDEIGAALSSVFENLNKVIQKNKETGQLTKAFEAGAAAIEAFGEVLAGIIDILIEMAAQGGEPAAEAIKKFGIALQDAAPTIGLMFGALARAMNLIMTFVGWFAKLLKAMEPVTRKCQEAAEAWDELVMKGKAFENLGPKIVGAFAIIKKAITDAVTKSVEAVKKWWEDTKKAIEKGVTDALKAIKKFVEDIPKNIKKMVDDAIKNVKKWWEDTKKAIEKGVADAVKALKKWWDDTKKAIEKGVTDAIEAVQKWWDETVQAIEDGIKEWLDGIKQWWDDTVKGIQEGVKKAVDEVKKLPDQALKELKSSIPDFKGVGEDMGDGMAEGLKSAAGKLAGIAAAAAANALAAAKAVLGIRSPSAVMRDEVGRMMIEGWAQGIIGNADLLSEAVRRAGLGSVGAGRGVAGSGAALGRSGGQTLTIQILGGADSAVGVMIQRLAQQGKLKITANAVVGGRR